MNRSLASIFLRIGLAGVFLYAAIASFMAPAQWVNYLPQFIATSSSANLYLDIFSVIEILLALWLLWGKRIVWAALISAVLMAGVIIFNLSSLYIVFRDFGLLFAALALATL